MNINTNVIALNANSMLQKKQLDKEVFDKKVESGLRINEEIEESLEIRGEIEVISDENLIASESKIKDIVMAEEILKNTKNSILEQSAISMLAQANQNSKDVISLLQ